MLEHEDVQVVAVGAVVGVALQLAPEVFLEVFVRCAVEVHEAVVVEAERVYEHRGEHAVEAEEEGRGRF